MTRETEQTNADTWETDLILSLDSFLTVTKLGVHWFKQIVKGERKKRWMYFGRALACLGWVILTLVKIIALILIYSG
jgi:hypothetical protein